MSADWETGHKDGHQTKTIQVGNCTVRIHRPLLDAEERERREESVRTALLGLNLKGR